MSKISSIYSKNAPEPIGPYSQAVIVGDFIFCSGQVGINPKTGKLSEGIENQVRQIMKNIESILAAANSDLEHVVKTTLFLTNINDFSLVNTVYSEFFSEHKPARSTVEVSNLPKGKLTIKPLIEIEIIATKK